MNGTTRGPAAILFVTALAASAAAQEPVRAGVVGAPPVGAAAPVLVLPYLTARGNGPADQPFRLSAELGRVVVLVFGPAADTAGWRGVAERADGVWQGVVTVGVLRVGRPRLAALAAGLGGERLKLLPDSTGRGHRGFGVRRGGWGVVVVDDAGRIAFRGEGRPDDPGMGEKVAAAVRRGRSLP